MVAPLIPPDADPPDDLLARATELRAEGMPWTAVAAELGLSARVVRRWPADHPQRWKIALGEAELAVLAEATFEAVHTLRKQLRLDDEKANRDAAHELLQLRIAVEKARVRPQPASAHDPPGGLTDEQLLALLAAGPLPALPPRAGG